MEYASFGLTIISALVLASFLAGFVDAIAGGGGMIQVPALLVVGVPPVSALATNKIISVCGTSVVVCRYAASNLIAWKYVGLGGGLCIVGSLLGSSLALYTPAWILEFLILASILVALSISAWVPLKHQVRKATRKSLVVFSGVIGGIGFYDGLSGPGTGSFLAIANARVLGLDLLRATALAKPINLMSNLGAALVFIYGDAVQWSLALPMLVSNCAGNWLGGKVAVRQGSALISRLLICVLSALLIANVYRLAF